MCVVVWFGIEFGWGNLTAVFSVILGGGFLLGSLVMIMEDTEAPHHLLLLRNFMAQGLVHCQPLLFAGTTVDPRAFLGTLPSPLPLPSSHAECAKGGGPARAGLDGGPGAAATEVCLQSQVAGLSGGLDLLSFHIS